MDCSRNVRVGLEDCEMLKRAGVMGNIELNSLVRWQGNLEVAVCHVTEVSKSPAISTSLTWGEKSYLLKHVARLWIYLVCVKDALACISEVVILLKAPSDSLSTCPAGSVMLGRYLLVTSTARWLGFFVIPLLEWTERFEISLGVRVAEILQICCDSHRAAPAFAESAEEHAWETCELVPAALAERSALSAVLQLICRSLGRGDHISLPSAVEGGGFCFCK